MEVNVSPEPARAAGALLTKLIESHDTPVLCLLSGGSALDVIPHLTLTPEAKGRTIFVMGDERWSREPTVNNYRQLAVRYERFVSEHTVIDTSVKAGETHEAYATRISDEVGLLFHDREPLNVIALLGIGTDGHTAGIFPMEESAFARTYAYARFYSPVTVENDMAPHRASITPIWIQQHVANAILYAAGSSKRAILDALFGTDKPIHEMPAQLIKQLADSTVITDQTR